MKCIACDSELTDEEAVTKNQHTGAYIDMCCVCTTALDATIDAQSLDPYDSYIVYEAYLDAKGIDNYE